MPTDATLEFGDMVREQWGSALDCVSGARCEAYTAQLQARGIPAATKSAHIEGLALDLAPKDMSRMAEFHRWCAMKREIWRGGEVGMEDPKSTPGWCHLQLRKPFKIFKPGA